MRLCCWQSKTCVRILGAVKKGCWWLTGLLVTRRDEDGEEGSDDGEEKK